MHGLTQKLLAPSPGWVEHTDVIIVGSGVAGLTAALSLRESGQKVLIITKDVLTSSSSIWAQGGVAAALSAEDSPEEHLADTLVAGAGLCDPHAVRDLVTQGPAAVRRLIELGAVFDRDEQGEIALAQEGGHQRRRVAHAGGDATGAEIIRALITTVLSDPSIKVIEHAVAIDLEKDTTGQVVGAICHVIGEGRTDGVGAVRGKAVVLATGGIGAVFAQTTNPLVASGDGLAIALRAGASVADLEFVQFHPTVLWLGPDSRGRQPLVTEAVRGEGATLLTLDKQPLMLGVHPLGDLAPRDIVAKAIARYMNDRSAAHVWLDARSLGEKTWLSHFPTVLSACRENGIDPVTDLIPVVPAAHYASGGVIADMYGRTSVTGLYAVGECACTGVHGANRLASNSLLEGLVVAERLGKVISADSLRGGRSSVQQQKGSVLAPEVLPDVLRITTEFAGLVRTGHGLTEGLAQLADLRSKVSDSPSPAAWGATNVHTVATALLTGALTREESRGSHWREDFPATDDAHWRNRVSVRMQEGEMVTSRVPLTNAVFSAQTEKLLQEAGFGSREVRQWVENALAEDAPGGIDLTSDATISADHRSTVDLVARTPGVVCGTPIAAAVFESCAHLKGGECVVAMDVADGQRVSAGDVVMTVTGNSRALLMAERTALNYLGHLSGVATQADVWTRALGGTNVRVRDTRKTTPGLRKLEKYAVRVGGGLNHRMDLAEAILIKDNHIAAAGSVTRAVELARQNAPGVGVQVEVDDLGGLQEALAAGADEILLDNFQIDDIRTAVVLTAGKAKLEASGGLTLERIGELASAGVDFLAVGALTHSAPNLDIGADFRNETERAR